MTEDEEPEEVDVKDPLLLRADPVKEDTKEEEAEPEEELDEEFVRLLGGCRLFEEGELESEDE